VVGANGQPTDNAFVFDFSQLGFVDGSGLTVISNTMEWLFHHQIPLQFTRHARPNVECIAYLDDCGFFERYIQTKLRPHASVRNTTVPFTRICEGEAHEWLEYRFTPFMQGVLGVPSGALGSIRGCVGEVFNNIQDHSTLNVGFAHIQHYPRLDSVRITVSDFGRGIPNTIRDTKPDMTDTQAILFATHEGITSQTTPRNRGLGLDLLIRRVTSNNGTVTIYSYNGALVCSRAPDGRIVRLPLGGNGAYPGTLVDINLKTDCFIGDDFAEEELEW
jgi:hypothetical protein